MAKSRKTIEQRIALDGGKEILDTLKALGKDGEKAFQQLQRAAKDAGSPGIALAKSIATLRKNLKELGDAGRKVAADFQNLKRASGDFGASVATVGRRLLGTVAAVGALGAATVKFTQAGTQAADAAGKQAAALGLAVDAYTGLQFAAEQSGLSAEQFGTVVTRLNATIGDAAQGNKTAAEQFQRLGVNIRDAAGNIRPTEEVLKDVADAFARLPDGATKSAAAVDLLGRTGAQAIPFLNEARVGIEKLEQQAELLGIRFSQQQVKDATAFNDSLSALGRGASALRNQLGLLFAPSLTKVSDGLTNAITANGQAVRDFVDGQFKRAIPIVEDLIAVISGRDVDVRNGWILEAKEAVLQFADAVKVAVMGVIVPAYELLIAAGEKVAGAINSVFGTEFTSQQVLIAGAILKLLGVFASFSAAIGVVTASAKLLLSTFALIGPIISSVSALFSTIALGAQAIAPALAFLVSWPALLVAAFVAAGVAIYLFWDEIVAAGEAALGLLAGAARGFGRAIAGAFRGVVSLAKSAFDGISAAVRPALSKLVEAVNGIVTQVGAAFGRIKTALDPLWQSTSGAATSAWELIKEGAFLAGDWIMRIFDALKRGAQIVWDGIVSIVATAWEAVRRLLLTPLFNGLKSAAEAVWNGFRNGAAEAVAFAIRQVDRLKAALDRALAALRRLRSAEDSSGSTTTTTRRYAGGGYVRGPGTSTSDSILAWLSDNEFVMRARAVRHYGADFMAAINSLRFPKLPGYATGGLVGGRPALPRVSVPRLDFSGLQHALTGALAIQAPRFATGGPVLAPASSGRALSLTIGGEIFGGLTAPDDVADRLSKFARGKQLASAGRKPRWYGQ